MPRKTLLASTLALLIAGAASLALAQDRPATPPDPAATPMAAGPGARFPYGMRGSRDMPGPDDRRGPRMHGHDRGPANGGVIADLRALEHLYMQSGRTKELPALYKEVLAKSQDPRVREYAYHHLARAQMRPVHVDEAIATLRKSLDENLANEARRRAQREQMRSRWQQRSGAATAPSVK